MPKIAEAAAATQGGIKCSALARMSVAPRRQMPDTSAAAWRIPGTANDTGLQDDASSGRDAVIIEVR
jgi:hypothetical protein